MFFKSESRFHAVAVSDHEDPETLDQPNRQFYRPVATKPPLLVALLCSILACIALLQVAISNSVNKNNVSLSSRHVHRRQLFSSVVTTFSESWWTLTASTETFEAFTRTWSGATFTTTETYAASTQTITGTTQLIPASTQIAYSAVTTVAGTPTTIVVDLYTVTNNGVVSTITEQPEATTTSQAYLDTSKLTTMSSQTSHSTQPIVVSSAPPPASYLDTSTPSVSSVPTSHTTQSLVVSSAPPPASYLDTSTPSVLSGSTSHTTQSIITSSTTFTIASTEYLDPSEPTTWESPTSPADSSSTAIVDIDALPQSDHIVNGSYTMLTYYTATYLCSFVVVLLKCVWSIVFASTKMVEPFYQLTRPGGAYANVSLFADYFSSSLSRSGLSSLLTAQPLMLMAAVVSAVTTVMAPVASEAMSIKASELCPQADGTATHCAPIWILNVPSVRLLQVVLGIMFCLVVVYIFVNFRRKSGLFSDPSSIAAVASMLGNHDILQELRQIPIDASTKDIKNLLARNKYTLTTFSTNNGIVAYGIVNLNNQAPKDRYHARNHPSASSNAATKRPQTRSRLLQDILLLALSSGLLTVIVAYYLDSGDNGFNQFFSNNTFGPRFVLSATAIVLDNRWKRLEREVRALQPYRILHRRSRVKSSRSAKALCAKTASTAYTSFPIALCRGHFFLALVSFVAILGDVLIIAIVGVPFESAQIYSAFLASTWLSTGILSLMIITALVTMMWWRRSNPAGMPHEPNSLIAVALYLCASQMTEEFASLSMATQEQRDRVVKTWGKTYRFGYGLGEDRQARWLVDWDTGNFLESPT